MNINTITKQQLEELYRKEGRLDKLKKILHCGYDKLVATLDRKYKYIKQFIL